MYVTINGKIYEYEDGTILKNIAEDLAGEYKYPILLANVDGKLQELHHHLNHDANVVFFHICGSHRLSDHTAKHVHAVHNCSIPCRWADAGPSVCKCQNGSPFFD